MQLIWQSPRIVYMRSKTVIIGVLVKPYYDSSVIIDWYEMDDTTGVFEKMDKSGPTLEVGKGTYKAKVLYFGTCPKEGWCHPITVLPPVETFTGKRIFVLKVNVNGI